MTARYALTDLLKHKPTGKLCSIISRTDYPSHARGKTPTTIYTVRFWQDGLLVRTQYNEDDLEIANV